MDLSFDLNAFLEKTGLSQAELSYITGVSQATLSNINIKGTCSFKTGIKIYHNVRRVFGDSFLSSYFEPEQVERFEVNKTVAKINYISTQELLILIRVGMYHLNQDSLNTIHDIIKADLNC